MGDYVPNIVLLFNKELEEEKRRKNKMTNIKIGDTKYIPVKIDAIMTGLNSGEKVRIILPTGEKLWLDPLMLEDREEE